MVTGSARASLMGNDWIPVAGDIITPLSTWPFYVGRRRMDLQPGMLLTVLYSENPAHGTKSHNLDVYHPDFGKALIIIDRNDGWNIVNRQTKENA